MKAPFIWDYYSDQPHVIKDRAYKKAMKKKHIFSYLKLLFSSLFILPISIILMKFFKDNKKLKYGMSVNLDKGNAQQELIEELAIKHLLIRIPLWEIEKIDEYLEFAKSFGEDKKILLNILQDREHIENPELLKKHITLIFEKFSSFIFEYQIANAINRTKWGFFSVDEYLEFFKVIQVIRDEKFKNLKLIGPSIIDFEYYYTVRALFNCKKIKFDKNSSLLYVDRRGAPSNTQYGIFDTKNKVDLLYSMTKLSSKVSNDIYITEVNWPLSNTAPYAPTSELECVSEADYTKYMLEYHKIVKETKKVDIVYWHQLIAPGYGLVDNREDNIRKMLAFDAYKKMIRSDNE
jgi:hypothetical protein